MLSRYLAALQLQHRLLLPLFPDFIVISALFPSTVTQQEWKERENV